MGYLLAVQCPNTCEELGRVAREAAAQERTIQLQGYAKRLEYQVSGAAKYKQREARIAELDSLLAKQISAVAEWQGLDIGECPC